MSGAEIDAVHIPVAVSGPTIVTVPSSGSLSDIVTVQPFWEAMKPVTLMGSPLSNWNKKSHVPGLVATVWQALLLPPVPPVPAVPPVPPALGDEETSQPVIATIATSNSIFTFLAFTINPLSAPLSDPKFLAKTSIHRSHHQRNILKQRMPFLPLNGISPPIEVPGGSNEVITYAGGRYSSPLSSFSPPLVYAR
jgi:hypothetical protein